MSTYTKLAGWQIADFLFVYVDYMVMIRIMWKKGDQCWITTRGLDLKVTGRLIWFTDDNSAMSVIRFTWKSKAVKKP